MVAVAELVTELVRMVAVEAPLVLRLEADAERVVVALTDDS